MNKKHISGFTLIEVMIVVVVIAILAAIAWPSYQSFIRQARLEGARADLLANAQMMERFYSRSHTFCPTSTSPCSGFPAASSFSTEKSGQFFDLAYAASSPTADNYILHANPKTESGETRYLRYDSTSSMMLCEPDGSANAASDVCRPY